MSLVKEAFKKYFISGKTATVLQSFRDVLEIVM